MLSGSVNKRLWLGGSLVAIFLLTLLAGNQVIAPQRSLRAADLGNDFIAFYTAGSLVRQHRADLIYDIPAVADFQRHIPGGPAASGKLGVGPWWNPPFYALVFVPLSALPFRTALALWTALNVLALLAAIWLLCRMLLENVPADAFRYRVWALAPLLMLASMPFIAAFSHGQNTFTSLLLLTAAVAAWRSSRPLLAGLIAGLLFYKPQLGAVVAVAMVATLGWRAAVGLALSVGALLLLNLLFLPGTLTDYLHRLPANVHYMQVEHAYMWERHVTLKAYWRLLLQGRGPGEASLLTQALTYLSCAALGAALLAAWWRIRQSALGFARPDLFIAATIAAMPLLMPFYFDYDLMLLSVPAVLLAGHALRRPGSADGPILALWTALFLWLFVNTAVASRTDVNVTVLLLAALAVMIIRKAVQKAAPPVMLEDQVDALSVAA